MLERVYLDQLRWRDYLSEKKPTTVISANWAGVNKNQRHDQKVQRENLDLVMELASYSKSAGVKKFIAFGSQSEVPNSNHPIGEDLTVPQGDSYGQIKSKLGLMLHDYFKESRTRLIWLRPFSIYGPKDSNESLIPQMFQAALSGTRFKLSNPGLTWSALHISDFGGAIKKIVEADHLQGVINIGSPDPTSVYEYAKAAEEALGQIFPSWDGCDLSAQPNQAGKIPKVEKLHSLGWSQQFNLKTGVEDTVNWLSANYLRKPMRWDTNEAK